MSYAKTCVQCGRDFISRRPDAQTDDEECKYQRWIETNLETPQPVGPHPLQAVRDRAALNKHTRDLNGLIRQAIIDRIKTRGDCHADDLIDLYPVNEVDRCRELATRQFASLRSGKNPLISERERRASSMPARKRAKSGVYVFTKHGRETLVGPSGGSPRVGTSAAVRSGEKENAGLSAAAQLDPSLGGPAGCGRSTEPGETHPGVGSPRSTNGDPPPASTVATDAGSPDSLIQLDGARKAPSMYDPMEGEAA